MNDKDLIKTLLKSLDGIKLVIDESKSNISNEIRFKLNEIINNANSLVNNELIKEQYEYKVLTPNVIYRHRNNNDVGFMPMSVGFTDEEIICRGYWMNIANPRRHHSVDFDTIAIRKDELENWSEVKQAYTTSVYGGKNVHDIKENQ